MCVATVHALANPTAHVYVWWLSNMLLIINNWFELKDKTNGRTHENESGCS